MSCPRRTMTTLTAVSRRAPRFLFPPPRSLLLSRTENERHVLSVRPPPPFSPGSASQPIREHSVSLLLIAALMDDLHHSMSTFLLLKFISELHPKNRSSSNFLPYPKRSGFSSSPNRRPPRIVLYFILTLLMGSPPEPHPPLLPQVRRGA